MRKKKKDSVVGGVIVSIVSHIIYILGLSLIIPMLFLYFFPQRLWTAVSYAKPILYVSVGLVILSMLVLYMYNKSIGKTFFSLGLATFVPGSVALLFSVYNKEIIFSYIKKYVVSFELIEPLIDTYLAHALPTVWIVTIVYLIIGFVFIWIGVQKLRMESTESMAKRVFGPRARILR